MYISKNCSHFIYQNDNNGEMAIGVCNLMTNSKQNHEGNYGVYKCPLGKNEN
jgi:hypothetical protein